MASLEELIEEKKNSKNKDGLLEEARENEIVVSDDETKAEIAGKIVRFELGLPDEESDETDGVGDDVDGDTQDEGGAITTDDLKSDSGEKSDDHEKPEKDEPTTVEPAPQEVLLRYTGNSLHIEVGGLRFGRKNPFRPVSPDKAQEIIDSIFGSQFSLATPREIQDFYS